jgi:FG-GAP-like repeat
MKPMLRLALLLSTLTTLVAPQNAIASQFRRAVYYGVGSHDFPKQVVSARLTNSGNLDLVVADYLSDQVTVMLGKGDGTFQAARRFSVPAPIALETGDFNSDGKEDLVIIESGGTGNSVVAIFLGNGDGTFRKAGSNTVGVYSAGLTVADFNGDGHLDVAVANRGFNKPGSVMVLFGDGTGKLRNRTTYKIAGGPWGIAAGDMNGDVHPDLAVALDLGGSVAVLINDGTGHFGKPVSYDAGGGEVVDVKIADLRHDGRNDLAVVNHSINEIAILLNNGDGTFAPAKFYVTGSSWGTGTNGVVIADFNLDGKLDLAASNQDGNSALLYGKGDGTFKPATPIDDEIKFTGAIGLAVGDFNHDNAPDLAFAMYFINKVAVMLNTK